MVYSIPLFLVWWGGTCWGWTTWHRDEEGSYCSAPSATRPWSYPSHGQPHTQSFNPLSICLEKNYPTKMSPTGSRSTGSLAFLEKELNTTGSLTLKKKCFHIFFLLVGVHVMGNRKRVHGQTFPGRLPQPFKRLLRNAILWGTENSRNRHPTFNKRNVPGINYQEP